MRFRRPHKASKQRFTKRSLLHEKHLSMDFIDRIERGIGKINVTTRPLKKVKKILDRFLGEQNSILRLTDKFLRQLPCV